MVGRPTDCSAATTKNTKLCLDEETKHLIDPLPIDGTPSKPVSKDNVTRPSHRITCQPWCNDYECGQRIQLITMQGHEIRMMDEISEASNISLTTSDGSQQLRLDELNKITWLTSSKHHIILSDSDHVESGGSNESAKYKYVDPNKLSSDNIDIKNYNDRDNTDYHYDDFDDENGQNEGYEMPYSSNASKYDASSYILLQSEKKHKLWLADTETHPRIHARTIEGHEILLLDKSPENPGGKIQITTKNNKMQILMDLDSKDMHIVNREGSIKLYAKNDIELNSYTYGPIEPSVEHDLIVAKKDTN